MIFYQLFAARSSLSLSNHLSCIEQQIYLRDVALFHCYDYAPATPEIEIVKGDNILTWEVPTNAYFLSSGSLFFPIIFKAIERKRQGKNSLKTVKINLAPRWEHGTNSALLICRMIFHFAGCLIKRFVKLSRIFLICINWYLSRTNELGGFSINYQQILLPNFPILQSEFSFLNMVIGSGLGHSSSNIILMLIFFT